MGIDYVKSMWKHDVKVIDKSIIFAKKGKMAKTNKKSKNFHPII